MRQRFDVVVIGLGAMGAAALYQLSGRNLSVVGIDRHSPPHAHGSSHGETRITRQAMGEGVFYTPLVKRANEIWHELEQQSGEKLHEQCGVLLVSQPGHPFYETTLKAAQEFNIDHQLLDHQQVQKLFPALQIESDQIAYYEPTAGYLYAEKCIEQQLKLARANGATTLTGSEVVSITENASGVLVTLMNGQQIRADKAIVAAGPWVHSFIPPRIQKLFSVYMQTLFWFDIEHTHYEQLRPGTLPILLYEAQKLLRTDDHTDLYGFPAVNGKTGGMKFASRDLLIVDRPEDKDRAGFMSDQAERLYGKIAQRIKFVKPDLLKSANCLYTVTPDGDFVIDWLPDSRRIVLASPCSGHGFKHSPAIGEILADLVTTGETRLDISHFRLDRFS